MPRDDLRWHGLWLVVLALGPWSGSAQPLGAEEGEERLLLRVARHEAMHDRQLAWPDPEMGSTVIGPEVGRGDLSEVDDLTDSDLRGLVECLAMRASRLLPFLSWRQQRNYAEALALVPGFAAVRPELERKAAAGELGVDELREVLAGVVPTLQGDHETVLEHQELPSMVMDLVED